MQIDLSTKEFRRLLDLVYIGNWVLNSTRGNDRFADYDNLESKLFGMCKGTGMQILVEDWNDPFGVTISRNLSGSFNAAEAAAREFAEEHPDAKIHIFDTLSAGPEMAMVTEKIVELVNQGLSFEEIVAGVREYQNHCHILFCLESMNNLARNGRVNPAVAKIASVLGIRACGDAQNGQIIPTQKPRGQKKATETLAAMIRERGFTNSSWLRIAHCFGENQAQLLIDALKKDFPDARYTVEPTGVLCSFYAEEGGLMIAMEGSFNEVNNVNDI